MTAVTPRAVTPCGLLLLLLLFSLFLPLSVSDMMSQLQPGKMLILVMHGTVAEIVERSTRKKQDSLCSLFQMAHSMFAWSYALGQNVSVWEGCSRGGSVPHHT